MPLFPAAVPALPPLVPFTQDQILALFDRILPSHYLTPLKDPGPGYEYLQAVAKMIARVSEAIAHVGSGCYIGSAEDGAYATGQVELYRASDLFGPVTLLGRDAAPQGTLVGTEDGYLYQLMNTVYFEEGDLGPYTVTVQAVTRGWLWNRPGPFITPDGEFVPGPINQLVRPVFPLTPSPPNFDPTIQVRQRYWGYVTFTRPTSAAGAAVLKEGTLLADSAGRPYRTLDDAVFGATSVGPVKVRYIPLSGNDGPVTALTAPLWGPDSAIDNTIVISTADFVQENIAPRYGVAPMLEALGNDRGIPRNFSGISSVQIGRTNTNPITILPGTVLSTADGFHYQTTSLLTFAAGETFQKSVSVAPLFLNTQANYQPISLILSVRWGTSEQDPTLVVATSQLPTLETVESYRTRMTFLPDTVTPNAVRKTLRDTLDALFLTLGASWSYREVWDLRYQTAYDFPRTLGVKTELDHANLNVPVAPFNSAVFVYDAVPLNEALSNRYLAANPERGIVVIRLTRLSPGEVMAQNYPGLAENIEKIKPAGTNVLYVLGEQ